MTKSSIVIDLDDPRTAKIADVISNKTAKKILSSLTEKELSESDLSQTLKLPMNTINYNIKKLYASGLIEKTKNYQWSVKGKKIHKYKISNKRIVISPRAITRGVLPTILISGLLAVAIKLFVNTTVSPISSSDLTKGVTRDASTSSASGAIPIEEPAAEIARILPPQDIPIDTVANAVTSTNIWAWFLLGAFTSLLIFLLWNHLKTERRNKNGTQN